MRCLRWPIDGGVVILCKLRQGGGTLTCSPGAGTNSGASSATRRPLVGHGAFRLILALIMIVLAVARILPPGVPEFVRAVLPMLGVLFLVVGMVSIVTGGGLFARQSWARTLAIVFGGLNLVDIPFGTALGIYTLWVLIPEESEREYNLIVRG